MSLRKGMLVTILPLNCNGIVRSVGRWGMKVAVAYWSRAEQAERVDSFMPHDIKPVSGSHYFADAIAKAEGR